MVLTAFVGRSRVDEDVKRLGRPWDTAGKVSKRGLGCRKGTDLVKPSRFAERVHPNVSSALIELVHPGQRVFLVTPTLRSADVFRWRVNGDEPVSEVLI
jgi:hypothetical protein